MFIISLDLKDHSALLCVLVDKAPQLHDEIIYDFSELLALIMPKFDNILIVGDF